MHIKAARFLKCDSQAVYMVCLYPTMYTCIYNYINIVYHESQPILRQGLRQGGERSELKGVWGGGRQWANFGEAEPDGGERKKEVATW